MNALFKAKSIEEDTYGQWVNGYLVKGKWENPSSIGDIDVIISPDVVFSNTMHGSEGSVKVNSYVEIDPETICIFTGLSDGEYKIWEHDIFQYDDETYEVMWCNESLSWDAVSVYSSESISLGEFLIGEIDVIGNSIDGISGEE